MAHNGASGTADAEGNIRCYMRPVNFERWKTLLRNDCIAVGKLYAFDGIGEVFLRILYDNGVDPTVEAIVRDGLCGKQG